MQNSKKKFDRLLLGLVMVLGLFVLSQGVGAEVCTDDKNEPGRLVTFVNNSTEEIFIGVRGSVFGAEDERLAADTGYSHPKEWKMGAAKGSLLTWCAPKHFNGRFFARTGCVHGKCKTGDCCSEAACSGNVCTKTPEPTSLAEIFVDSKRGTYYDISFVDGYDFPLLIKPVNMSEGKPRIACDQAGCITPPACLWGVLVNGACLSPYKQFELDYADYRYRPEYYPLAAMCVQNLFKVNKNDPDVCGCGKTKDCKLDPCPTSKTVLNPYSKQNVTLISSGCSPLNRNYNNPGEGNGSEQYQITCDPTSENVKTVYGTDCHPWSAAYRLYTTRLNKACGIGEGGKTKAVYTWQYDDDHGLFQCANDEDMGFEVTILPRDTSTPQAELIVFNPGYKDDSSTAQPVTGTLTTNGKTYHLKGPDPLKLAVKKGDALKLELDCEAPGFSMTCALNYDSQKGFIVDEAQSAAICSDTANFKDWSKTSIGLAYPDLKWCKSSSQFRLQVSPAPDAGKSFVCIGSDKAPKTFNGNPIVVFVNDNSTFRLVQNCGSLNGKTRVVDCIADFKNPGGFTVREIPGASPVCKILDWKTASTNGVLGFGSRSETLAVDCVEAEYVEVCSPIYTEQDAKATLRVYHQQSAKHPDPLLLDHNNDGKVNLIDAIMLLRRSVGH